MITAQVFETPPIERGKFFSYSEAFCEGGPNPREGSKSASGFGPGGPNLGGSKSAGTPALRQCVGFSLWERMKQ